jgi:phage FluMu protein Com
MGAGITTSLILVDNDKGNFVNYEDEAKRAEESNVRCTCGETALSVNYIQAPYTGCFLKITCPKCKTSNILFDDFS